MRSDGSYTTVTAPYGADITHGAQSWCTKTWIFNPTDSEEIDFYINSTYNASYLIGGWWVMVEGYNLYGSTT